MKKKYVTIVGCDYYFGIKIFNINQKLLLEKDYENEYDDEAISVSIESVGQVGYVANSTHTVAKGTSSAGRIYDCFDDETYALVKFIVDKKVIAEMYEDIENEDK